MKRKMRIRRKIVGGADRPRMSIFRSLNHVYVQVIDDARGVTLAGASSLEEGMQGKRKDLDKKALAKEVGKLAAERCKAKGIKQVVFDRSGFRYHGRLKSVADGAREGGLDF